MSVKKWVEEDFQLLDRRDLSQIQRVLIVTMLLNFLATGIKLSAGLATGALSVVADALDSLFDGLSNIAGLAGLYAASKPPDAEHPYGHRKFETIAALSIAFLLFLTSYQLLVTAWNRLGDAPQVRVTTFGLVAMLGSMLVQAATSLYELSQGRRLKSEVLVADAMHTRASILVSLSVLGGLGLVALGYPQADLLVAVFVALVIAKIGFDVLRETLPVLLDQAALDPDRIASVVTNVGGVESFHRVRSRGPVGNVAIDLHIRVLPDKDIQEANAIADEVRRQLLNLEGVNDVTVHVEAQRQPVPDASDLFARIKHAALELGLTVFEVWAHRYDDELHLEMHIGVDPRLNLGDAHGLVDRLEKTIQERLPEVKGVHTHIELATTEVQVVGHATRELEGLVNQQVTRAIAAVPGLSEPHNIVVRRSPGEGDKIFISLECKADPQTPVSEAHYLASLLEQELSRRLSEVADVSVHLEPPDSD